MPQVGYAGITGVIRGKLYVYTARTTVNGDSRNGFYRYDPRTDEWASLPLPVDGANGSHQYGVGGVIDDKLYVVGGLSSHQLDMYDPASNRWTTVTTTLPIRSGGAGRCWIGSYT